MSRPVVSKRNEFHPADELVEYAMMRMPDQFKHPDFRGWLVRYTETTIKTVASHFGVAAQRGIEQAAELLCDPEFYETRKKRRSENTKRMREERAKQDWERNERLLTPTAEQIEDQIKWAEREQSYHQSKLNEIEAKLQTLRTKAPTVISSAPMRVQ